MCVASSKNASLVDGEHADHQNWALLMENVQKGYLFCLSTK